MAPNLEHLRPHATPKTATRESILALSAAYTAVANEQPRKGRGPAPQAPLAELDEFRYVELPALIKSRRDKPLPSKPNAALWQGYVEQAELERLVQWKLYRGTYRPSMPKFIASNSEDFVELSTAQGINLVLNRHADLRAQFPDMRETWDTVYKPLFIPFGGIKGVGPATATLLGSVAAPAWVPFFSDEAYAWFADSEGEPRKPEKYDYLEYGRVWRGVGALRERLNGAEVKVGTSGDEKPDITAADVERAAYVAVRLGLDRDPGIKKDVDDGKGSGAKATKETSEIKSEVGSTRVRELMKKKEESMSAVDQNAVEDEHSGKQTPGKRKRGNTQSDTKSPESRRSSRRTAK